MSQNNGSLASDLEGFFQKNTNFTPTDEKPSLTETVAEPVKTQVEVQDNTLSQKEMMIKTFYDRLESLGIKLDEIKPILECKDNLLVGSGAGSGKTTAITLRLIRDLIEGDLVTTRIVNTAHGEDVVHVPKKILIATFLKSGAQELQRSFYSWCNRLNLQGVDGSNFVFRTIHAEVMDAVKSMGVRMSLNTDGLGILRQVSKIYNIRGKTSTTREVSVDELRDLEGIIAFARNRLDASRYTHPMMEEYGLDSILLEGMITKAKMIRSGLSENMDFEDAQELLLEALKVNESVRTFIGSRYSRVIIDEFQDTSQLQYEVLKYYFAGAERVIAVGDDDQTIYSWRGSDNQIITTQFSKDIPSTTLNLTTNYRCKSNILDPIVPSLEKNKRRLPKQLRAHKQGGEVKVIKNGNVDDLIKSINADRLKNYSSGVLARVNADLLIPAILLELENTVDFEISKSVSMNARLPKQVFGVVKLVTRKVTDDFEDLLKMFVPRHQWHEAKKLTNILKMNPDYSLFTLPSRDLAQSVPNLNNFLSGLRTAKDLEEDGDVTALIYTLMYMSTEVYRGDSTYATNGRNLTKLFLDLIENHPKVNQLSVHEIDVLFNTTLPEKLRERINYKGQAKIKLSTVHEAKGKEWDSVYVWNFISGVFPNEVSKRAISDEEMEEERRISYIAMTRAKEKLTIFTDATKPSPFLLEFDFTKVQGYDVAPVSSDTLLSKPRKKDLEETPTTEKLLSSYMARIYDATNGYGTASDLATIDILQSNYSLAEMVQLLDSKYGADLDVEFNDEMMRNALDDIVNELITSGKYQA